MRNSTNKEEIQQTAIAKINAKTRHLSAGSIYPNPRGVGDEAPYNSVNENTLGPTTETKKRIQREK